MSLVKQEPALVMGAIQALLILGASFGLGLTDAQTGAILAFAAAVLSLITRQMVSPVAR